MELGVPDSAEELRSDPNSQLPARNSRLPELPTPNSQLSQLPRPTPTMSKRHIPESHTAHPNVTPLIDIIMCLIIFFMLVAKIGVDTGAQKIDIPTTILGTKIKDMGNTLVLNIPDGDRRRPAGRRPW